MKRSKKILLEGTKSEFQKFSNINNLSNYICIDDSNKHQFLIFMKDLKNNIIELSLNKKQSLKEPELKINTTYIKLDEEVFIKINFIDGMTWKEWLLSKFNEINEYDLFLDKIIKKNSLEDLLSIITYNNTINLSVKPDDFILERNNTKETIYAILTILKSEIFN